MAPTRSTRRLTDVSLIAVYVALAIVPIAAMVLGLRGRDLYGVLPPAPRPALTRSAVLSESYQRELVTWFEASLGLKGTSIGLDNALLYHVFHETRFGSTVVLGDHGVLFAGDDIAFYNKHGAAVPSVEFVDRTIARIGGLQRWFAGRGRAFIPVIVPPKTELWEDQLPARWKVRLPSPRPSEGTQRQIREALARNGVTYVDATSVMRGASVVREDLWGPDARHWSMYSACLTMRRIGEVYAALTHRVRPPHECEVTRKGKLRVADQDLMRLINAYWVYRGYKRKSLVHHVPVEQSPTRGRPSVLIIATSFGWELKHDAEASHLYGDVHYNYYNKGIVAPDDSRTDIHAGTPEWRDVIMSKDMYVLEMFEPYFESGSYVESFVNDLVAEIGEANLPPVPVAAAPRAAAQ